MTSGSLPFGISGPTHLVNNGGSRTGGKNRGTRIVVSGATKLIADPSLGNDDGALPTRNRYGVHRARMNTRSNTNHHRASMGATKVNGNYNGNPVIFGTTTTMMNTSRRNKNNTIQRASIGRMIVYNDCCATSYATIDNNTTNDTESLGEDDESPAARVTGADESEKRGFWSRQRRRRIATLSQKNKNNDYKRKR